MTSTLIAGAQLGGKQDNAPLPRYVSVFHFVAILISLIFFYLMIP